MPRGVHERALERLEGIYAAQGSRGVTEQMRIGELDYADGTHSIELYKYADKRRVMWFTGCVMSLKRSEPGRKLPAKKCEAASAYGDLNLRKAEKW